MRIRECVWEDRIQRAARSGIWNDDLRAHVEQCSACADVVLVTGAMRAEAVASMVGAEVPEPGRVWWRARLLARHDTAARATRPIAVWERFASIVGLVALVALVAVVWRLWPVLTASAVQVQQAWVLSQTTGLGVIFNSVALAAATLLAFLIWFGLSFVRAEV
jgi:hypothetical protein